MPGTKVQPWRPRTSLTQAQHQGPKAPSLETPNGVLINPLVQMQMLFLGLERLNALSVMEKDIMLEIALTRKL